MSRKVRKIVAKETRRAPREHWDELTRLVKTAVSAAVAEMLNGNEAV
jgi:hypothetical protein